MEKGNVEEDNEAAGPVEDKTKVKDVKDGEDKQQVEGAKDGEDEPKVEGAKDGEEKPELSEDPQMVWMRRYFAKSLGICFEDPPECLLDELSLEGVARYMASDKCNKIVVMTGAGISTSAGIPDFRSPDTGCYERLKKEYNIEDPQQLFQFSYFKDHPEPYYKYRKELWQYSYKPTPCHYFVRLLEKKNKLLRHFTQNIDGLEKVAGLSDEKLIQAHGTMATAHCMECEHKYSQQWIREQIFSPDGPVPICSKESCGGLVRPDIVMFGESLPARFGEHMTDIDNCDLLLIMGTSLVVQPFANLPIRTQDNVPRLYINLEKPKKTSNHPISILFFGGGFDYDKEDNIRDVYWQGTCDDGCYTLADLIGWGDELRCLVEEEHTRLNKELGITDENDPGKIWAAKQKALASKLQKNASSTTGNKRNGAAQKQKTMSGNKPGSVECMKQQGPVSKQRSLSTQKVASGESKKPLAGSIQKQKTVPTQRQRIGVIQKPGSGATHRPELGDKKKSEGEVKHVFGGKQKQTASTTNKHDPGVK